MKIIYFVLSVLFVLERPRVTLFSESEKRQPSAGNFSKLFQNFSSCTFKFAILFNFVFNFDQFPAEGGSFLNSLNIYLAIDEG